jgi:CBS domain-containing protein
MIVICGYISDIQCRMHMYVRGEAEMNEEQNGNVPITVADIMTERVIYLKEEDTLDTITKGMERYDLRYIPVVSVEGGRERLLGIISHRDLLRIAISSIHAETDGSQNSTRTLQSNL